MDKEYVAIIQARMGSKRFPKKMFATLADKKIIEWVIIRLKRSKLLSEIILATSFNKENDIFTEIADKYKISIFRGSENNVLERFAEAAKKYKAKNIIRVCADNPFIDPSEIDNLINYFRFAKVSYAFNHRNICQNNYADGFGAEIFTNTLLAFLNKFAKDKNHREHVTSLIWDYPEIFNLGIMKANDNLAFPNLRFDIDHINDLTKLENLIKNGVNINSSAYEIISIALKINNKNSENL